ncbi:MAG TPA: pentapeptide repeat-containing protein [Candidatus Sericytochromatia bacterium]
MASPTIKTGKNREGSRSFPLRLRLNLPLVTRRCAAVVLEVSFLAASALVPYSIGLYAKEQSTAQSVPLNPVLSSTEEAIAKTLAYPLRDPANRQVAPLTNLFWCGALVMPLVLTSWQLYLLGKTGKTTPKAWFGVKVVTAYGEPPGLIRAAFREGVGRWGLPGGTAYLLWRYTGAFPDFGILLGLTGLLLLAECGSSLFNSRRRTLHDKLAGTYVLDGVRSFSPYVDQAGYSVRHNQSVTLEVESDWHPLDENGWMGQKHDATPHRSVTTIVITPKHPQRPLNLWFWMRRHPGLTLLIIVVGSMASILGTFVGTQIYIQSQANRREFKKQDNQVFLALVKQIGAFGPSAIDERKGAILALARLDDPRTVPFLVDLLAQEKNSTLIDTLQQGLVSNGTKALPPLQRLNQSLKNDQETLRRRSTPGEQQVVALRQRATNRAIAKILTIYTTQLHNADLSRTNLGQVTTGAAPFTLVLETLDLSGINFRSANLVGASLRGSRFYGSGEDGRLGTFDDWTTDFSGADLREADLTGATLNNVLMNQTNLVRAKLNRADLANSFLSGANLSSVQLIGANLRQANLENASLTGADLGEANLTSSNLHRARLGQVKAVGSDFSFADLSESNWQGSNLSGANLKKANLQDADLSSTRLVGANLRNAQLQNAKLRNSNLSSADLRGANLTGTDFRGVIFVTATPDSSNQFIESPLPNATAARFKGVNFTKAKNLDPKQIKFICIYGGRHPQCPEGK